MADIHRVDCLEDLPESPPEADFVMVDVILSSTTIVRLLELGVGSITPFATPAAARTHAESAEDIVLVGEQGGMPIDGFDHTPIPSVLAANDLAGRHVALVTSNGTRAIDHVREAGTLFVSSTINADAVADTLAGRDRDTWLIAAGRQGTPTPEDTAGVDLIESALRGDRTDETVTAARAAIESAPTAEWLTAMGFENDIESMLAVDSSDVVPRLEDGQFVPE